MIDSAVLFANNASSRLYQDTASGSATIRVQEGDGDKFPQPAGDGSNWFMVTVEDRRTGQIEIMKCTGRTDDILNVVRAQEATTAQNFLGGASVSNRLTAGTMQTFFQFNGYSMADADARFVNVSGDTMGGVLILAGAPTQPLHAATKQYVDDVSIDEAPTDGRAYARVGSTHDWLVVGTGIAEAPNDGKLYGRGGLAWAETVTIGTFNTEVSNRTSVDAALSARIDNADAINTTQNTRLNNIEGVNATQEAHLTSIDTINNTQNTRLDTIEGLDATQNTRLTAVETKNTEQDGRLTAVEGVNTTQNTRLDGIDTLNTTQNTRLTNIETKNTTQDSRLDAVETKNTSQDVTLGSYGTRITNTENTNTTQDGRLTAIEAKNVSQDTQIGLRLTDAPADGFVYGRKNGVWATVIGGATTDDNPPAGPLQDGQLWWKSSTGALYIWYDDGNSQAWVQVSAMPQTMPIVNVWDYQIIGHPIPIMTHKGAVAPPNNGLSRWIKLTAADAYNTGLLVSESVTGSAPLILATGVVSLAGSPMNGLTVSLWNTERRMPRAGSPGTLQNDQLQTITGSFDLRRMNDGTSQYAATAGGFTSAAASGASAPRNSAAPGTALSSDTISFSSADSPNARSGTETRPKNEGVDYYMRIL